MKTDGSSRQTGKAERAKHARLSTVCLQKCRFDFAQRKSLVNRLKNRFEFFCDAVREIFIDIYFLEVFGGQGLFKKGDSFSLVEF